MCLFWMCVCVSLKRVGDWGLADGRTEQDISASYNNGVLEVVVAKKDTESRRRIAVTKGSPRQA